jgi:hypothetical protein
VYGLLGLVDRGPCPHVDYRKTAVEVFLDVVQTISLDEWQTESRGKGPHKGRADGTLIKLLMEISESMKLKYYQQTIIMLLQNLLYNHTDTQPESVSDLGRRSHILTRYGISFRVWGFKGQPVQYAFSGRNGRTIYVTCEFRESRLSDWLS